MFRRLTKIFNSATELQRAAFEGLALHFSWPQLKASLPEGDGHPVLFFPGFLTGDAFTSQLRQCAKEKGYKVYGWDKGLNLGFDEETAEHLKQRLKEVFDENGGQKISLVGHSLGGIYARELAREFPDMVRDVITLGTPFGMLDEPEKATSEHLKRIYEFFNPEGWSFTDDDIQQRGLTPPPVPTTSMFSKGDGVVDWKASLNPATKDCENIEVYGSHIGMAFNPYTVTALLDRLAQKEGDWKPFDKSNYAALFFPSGNTEGPLPENPDWQHKPDKTLFKKKPKP